MEEDIKILEQFINNHFQKDRLEQNDKGGFKIGIIYKATELNPAIANLIKGYKELEEENKSYKKGIARYKKKCSRLEEAYIEESVKRISERFKTNYIPKSVIREKIKELEECIKEVEKNIKNTTDEEKEYWKKQKHDLVMQRNILQEVLEG